MKTYRIMSSDFRTSLRFYTMKMNYSFHGCPLELNLDKQLLISKHLKSIHILRFRERLGVPRFNLLNSYRYYSSFSTNWLRNTVHPFCRFLVLFWLNATTVQKDWWHFHRLQLSSCNQNEKVASLSLEYNYFKYKKQCKSSSLFINLLFIM